MKWKCRVVLFSFMFQAILKDPEATLRRSGYSPVVSCSNQTPEPAQLLALLLSKRIGPALRPFQISWIVTVSMKVSREALQRIFNSNAFHRLSLKNKVYQCLHKHSNCTNALVELLLHFMHQYMFFFQRRTVASNLNVLICMYVNL